MVRAIPLIGLGMLLAAVPLGTVAARDVPEFPHIFVIVMENREAEAVEGSPQAPYIAGLTRQYAAAGRHYAVTHPSLPNYLALTGGDTFGITQNCTTCSVNGPSLMDQIERTGKTWKAYVEDLPAPCFSGAWASGYAKKHNPFMYYLGIATAPVRCARVVPLTQLDDDLGRNAIPDFAWITPNLCHDMHDCSTATGDQWLGAFLPSVLASAAWRQGGVLFLTWDEGKTNAGCCGRPGGGRVLLLAISPRARSGFRSQTESNHYSLLRTIEDAWSLGRLGHAADPQTPALGDLFY